MGSGKVILGVLAGVAVGAGLGVLFAPEKGSETRRKLAYRKDELADDLEEKFNAFIDDVTSRFEAMKGKAKDVADEVTQQAQDIADDVTQQAQHIADDEATAAKPV